MWKSRKAQRIIQNQCISCLMRGFHKMAKYAEFPQIFSKLPREKAGITLLFERIIIPSFSRKPCGKLGGKCGKPHGIVAKRLFFTICRRAVEKQNARFHAERPPVGNRWPFCMDFTDETICVFAAFSGRKRQSNAKEKGPHGGGPKIRLCVQLFSAAGAFSPFLMKLTAKTRIERNIRPLAIR